MTHMSRKHTCRTKINKPPGAPVKVLSPVDGCQVSFSLIQLLQGGEQL